MISEKDRRHADVIAGFFSNLAVAYVAGAVLQVILPGMAEPAATATLFMVGLLLYGVAHIIVERAYGAAT